VIQAVSFDVGATLLRPYPTFGDRFVASCRANQIELPLGAAEEIEAFADAYFTDLRRRGVSYSIAADVSRQIWTTLYRSFLERHGVAEGRLGEVAEYVFATFLDPNSYQLYDDALPVVAAVRARGFRVGVVSNWEGWLPRLLGHTRLDALMDFTVISGVVGWEKPDRRIFDAAVAATGLPPGAILHVGDSPTSDVQGARAAGLRAILLDRAGRHAHLDVPRVSSLRELLDLPELREPSP
jgi:putative hydrolase of the HAD superfamily